MTNDPSMTITSTIPAPEGSDSTSREGKTIPLLVTEGGNAPPVQDAPPPAYYDFMRELHRIGGNLNQIAQKAHVLGVIDERRYDEEMRKFDQLVRDITKAVILPRAMDTKGSPRSLLRGEKEHPRSGEPFDACGKSGKRSAV